MGRGVEGKIWGSREEAEMGRNVEGKIRGSREEREGNGKIRGEVWKKKRKKKRNKVMENLKHSQKIPHYYTYKSEVSHEDPNGHVIGAIDADSSHYVPEHELRVGDPGAIEPPGL